MLKEVSSMYSSSTMHCDVITSNKMHKSIAQTCFFLPHHGTWINYAKYLVCLTKNVCPAVYRADGKNVI